VLLAKLLDGADAFCKRNISYRYIFAYALVEKISYSIFLQKKGADELFVVKRVMPNKTTELQCFYNGPQESSAGLSWILPPTVSTATES
jgi:hypothetical protein